jgi:WD40 repeat protein
VDYVPATAPTLAGPTADTAGAEVDALIEQALPEAGGYPSPPPGYAIEELLGRGGMGVVYRARQLGLNRVVALKMIRDSALAAGQEVARFRGEAEAVARLQHPNIVQIYEIGEYEGRPYFSLEYVAGGSLDKVLGGKPLPPDEAAGLVVILARAVHHAHLHGIVHRDLKPGNVLLDSREGAGSDGRAGPDSSRVGPSKRDLPALGNPKIGDFGLAKRLVETPNSGNLTQSGTILGTPSYMAPEQAGGKNRKIGPEVDVYALGAILYELLTGRPPFLAATPLDTLMQVINDEPVPPSRLQPKLARDLETICLKCLQKDPRKRYESGAALADDLERFLNGEPILARPVGRVERLGRWCRRNPVVAGLLAALIIVLVAGFAGVIWKWQDEMAASAEAAEQAQAAKEAEAEAKKQAKVARAAEKVADKGRQIEADLRHRALAETTKAETALYFNRVALANRYLLNNNVDQAQEILDICPPPLRGWEWHYLKHLCRAEMFTLAGHPGKVTCVAVSPDGRHIASGSFENGVLHRGVVMVWDATSGRLLFTFQGHKGSLSCLTYSPDGKRLATASLDGTAQLWDAHTGRPEPLAPLKHGNPAEVHDGGLLAGSAAHHGGRKGVRHVAFSHDGSRLATCADGTIKVWDAHTGQELFTLPGHTVECTEVAFNPDGKHLASGGEDRKIIIWNLATRKPVRTLDRHSAEVTSVAYGPQGRLLVSASKDRTVKVWQAEAGKEILSLRGHTDAVTRVRFTPDGRRVASASDDKTLRVWDATTGDVLSTFRGHAGRVNGLAYTRGGDQLISAGDDNTVKVWQASTGQDPLLVPGSSRVAFGSDGRFLATQSSSQTVTVWNLRTGQSVLDHKVPFHISSIAFRPGRRPLVCAMGNMDGAVWDLDGKEVFPTKKRFEHVNQAVFSPNGRLLALGGGSFVKSPGKIFLWEAATGKQLLTLQGHEGPVRCLAFSRDGKRLASGGLDLSIKVWDTASGRTLASLVGHADAVISVAFSPDGRLLASASEDGTVKLWDARTGKERLTLKGHTGKVRSVAFSWRDGRLASVSSDDTKTRGEVKVWDLQTGQELLTLEHPGEELLFSPDGRYLALAGIAPVLRLWDVTPFRELVTIREAGQGVAFSPQGDRLLSPGSDETVKLWDPTTRRVIRTFRGHEEMVRRALFSPDGRRIASAGEDGTVRIWNRRSAKVLHTLHGHTDLVNSVAFGPHGKRLASAGYDHKAIVWDAQRGKVLCSFTGHSDRVLCVAISPNGKRAASGSDDQTVCLWNARSGRLIRRLKGHGDSVNGVAFSPNGRLLASASDDRTIRLWDVRTGKTVRTLRGHSDYVRDVAFSPDGTRLASAGWDQTVRVWETAGGQEPLTLRGHRGGVRAVAFDPKGRRLASAGEDMTLRIWDLALSD